MAGLWGSPCQHWRRRREEKCVKERGSGPAFMLVMEGQDILVPWPWGIHLLAALAWPSVLSHYVGSIFFPTTLQCHIQLLRLVSSDLSGSFWRWHLGRFDC